MKPHKPFVEYKRLMEQADARGDTEKAHRYAELGGEALRQAELRRRQMAAFLAAQEEK